MGIQLLSTYLVAITLLTITPGVDTMLVIRNSARGGWWDGAVSSFGICSGLFMHAVVSAVGISVILMQTAWAFNSLKLMGACYLIWLGISNWKNVLQKKQLLIKDNLSTGNTGFNGMRSFREGFLSNILNPKTAIFYMAFLPQFINPSKSALVQSLILAGLHFIIAMIWQCFLAISINKAKNWLQKPTINRIFGSLTGSVMIFLGFTLATK
jgi:threonine/homoserine/homoserine lactone efflux protein